MFVSPAIEAQLRRDLALCDFGDDGDDFADGPQPSYGEAIFGKDYPRSWDEFVGQATARTHLQAVIRSAKERGARLDHVLLSAGAGGIGKSSLARLIAAEMGVGLLELSGPVKVDDARKALMNMQPGDILFYDEFHQAVTGGKGNSEWLLHLLQDGRLLTAEGPVRVPDVTVVAATTDAGKLPATILGRFKVRPMLAGYTEPEAVQILTGMARRLGLEDLNDDALALTRASSRAPREMGALLVAYRDSRYATPDGAHSVPLALEWVGVTHDGLTSVAQSYLVTLMVLRGGASLSVLAGAMNEPGPLDRTENLLISSGLIAIDSTGRKLTPAGRARAQELRELHDLTPSGTQTAAAA